MVRTDAKRNEIFEIRYDLSDKGIPGGPWRFRFTPLPHFVNGTPAPILVDLRDRSVVICEAFAPGGNCLGLIHHASRIIIEKSLPTSYPIVEGGCP